MVKLNGITASRYSPEDWLKMKNATGVGYELLTNRQQHGVVLYPTGRNNLQMVKAILAISTL